MGNRDLITTFLNSIVNNDEDAAKAAFSQYCNDKAKVMGRTEKIMERFDNFKVSLLEYSVDEPIHMEGDKILVNNKLVGHVKVDLSDMDSGIDFVSDDGTFSKEFNTAEDLFSFLAQRYLGETNVK